MMLYNSLLRHAQLGRALFKTLICSINIYPIELIFSEKLQLQRCCQHFSKFETFPTSFFDRRIKNMVFIFNKNIINF